MRVEKVFLLLFLALFEHSLLSTALADRAADPEALVLRKVIEKKLYPRTECISAFREAEEDGWISIAIREKHDKSCGGDPEVTPVLDRFRINTKTEQIQYYNPLEDEYESFAKFLSERKKP